MTNQEKNSQPTNSRVDIIQTVKTPLGFFTLVVLVVEAILGLVATRLSQGADRTSLINGMLILIILLVILVALLAFFRPEALFGKRPLSDNDSTITELSNRHLYMAAMLEHIGTAQSAVWLSVHTLNPSSTSQEVCKLQEELAKAKAGGKDVRLLAPSGAERVEAAYELNKQKGVPIKALAYLSVENLRYMIIDEDLSIISLESSENDQGSSTAGAVIRSQQLNRLLRGHFEQHWNQSSAMEYDAFLASEVRKLLNPSQPPSRMLIADNLQIPVSEVDKALRIQPAKVIFLLGRPGSGKTSAIRVITDYLQSVGYDKTQIAVHNDYRTLYSWFSKDELQKNFEPGPRGGFRVKNFAILDDCLREINKAVVTDMTQKQFIIVEFSRNQYTSALINFDSKILRSCSIFYLQTPMSTCIKRNEARGAQQSSNDEAGFVPPDILESYYKDDDIDKLGEEFAAGLVQIDNRQDGVALLRDKIMDEISKRLVSWLLDCKTQDESQMVP